MNNSTWKRKMEQCHKAYTKYKSLLDEIENEYVRRYEYHPSDIDDDWWIDTFHYGNVEVNAEVVFKFIINQAEKSVQAAREIGLEPENY